VPGISATGYSTTTLGGSSVSFGGVPAPLLYVSAAQLNVAVPDVDEYTGPIEVTSFSGSTTVGQFLTGPNPSIFLNSTTAFNPATLPDETSYAMAINANGTLNSANNPAAPGSNISMFVNGLVPEPGATLLASNGYVVTNNVMINPFVLQLDVQVPAQLGPTFDQCLPNTNVCTVSFSVYNSLGGSVMTLGPQSGLGGGEAGITIYVAR
jgi:uncharacterized protein (TIGR03437 family)